MTGGNLDLVGDANEQAAQAAQLLLEQERGSPRQVRLERVAAHQLSQPIGLVRRSLRDRPHFVKTHAQAAARDLPGSFRSGQTSTNHGDLRCHSRFQNDKYILNLNADGADKFSRQWERAAGSSFCPLPAARSVMARIGSD